LPVTVIVGGQYGSEGKGKMTSYLAIRDQASIVIRCGGPNAGHTVDRDGSWRVLRQIPSGFVNPRARLLIAGGAVVEPELLLREARELRVEDRVGIDRNAAVLADTDREAERSLQLGKRLASTLSGTGAATSRKVLRDAGLQLAADIPDLQRWLTDVSKEANEAHDRGELVLVEGTQGFGLSLHHGGTYPYRTSRDTTAANFLSEAGLSPLTVADIILVIRTFPIRVAGDSGPFHAKEFTWDQIRQRSGYPHEICEYTSVTGNIRRVAAFDMELVKRAVRANRPTHTAVHGLDYLDYADFGKTRYSDLTYESRIFIENIERQCGTPVSFVFTGPPNECIIDRRNDLMEGRECWEAIVQRVNG
jgi:adenylosuccinate synthase